jgi:hypothetical protein
MVIIMAKERLVKRRKGTKLEKKISNNMIDLMHNEK